MMWSTFNEATTVIIGHKSESLEQFKRLFDTKGAVAYNGNNTDQIQRSSKGLSNMLLCGIVGLSNIKQHVRLYSSILCIPKNRQSFYSSCVVQSHSILFYPAYILKISLKSEVIVKNDDLFITVVWFWYVIIKYQINMFGKQVNGKRCKSLTTSRP